MTKQEFIKKYTAPVLEATGGTALFPSLMLAQAALESGWGKSRLSSIYNNLFGIKADASWKGEKVHLSTQEFLNGKWQTLQEPFRVYADPTESIRDRIRFLRKNPRYAQVFLAMNPEAQARALQDAGYATDPQYAEKLIATMRANNLAEIDKKKDQ